MVKKLTSMNIDNAIIEEAKQKGLNMSAISEKALREQLGKHEVHIEDANICDFCGREEEKAQVIKGKLIDGLTWLYPDEKWICRTCLRKKSIRIV